MKLSLLILSLFFSLNSHAQHWQTISYVLDANGKEVAKRLPDSTWEISNPAKALEYIHVENERLKAKYQLALNILKLLGPNGIPVDKKAYLSAVRAYNQN